MLYFLHLKGVCGCLGRCFGKVQALGARVATVVATTVRRRRTFAQQQAAIRRRTVDAGRRRSRTTNGKGGSPGAALVPLAAPSSPQAAPLGF